MRNSRRLLVACLGLLAAGAGGIAAGAPGFEWRWSNPSPTGNSLIEVAFADSLRGLAISDQGEVAETRDGGWTWALRSGRLGKGHLLAAAIRPDGSVLASAADGNLWKSPDGGATWRAPAAFTGALYDIEACGPRTALAVGMRGTIVRSVDGGESWTRVRLDSLGPELLGVHCGEGPQAFAVGSNGLMLRSGNQGATWDTVALDSVPGIADELLTRVAFADSSRGLVSTGSGRVLGTRDGGLTWKATVLDSQTFFRGIAWRDSDVTLTGSDGMVWKSRDDGATWAAAESSTPQFVSASAHVGATGEVAVGDEGLILRSRDGGAHWESRRLGVTADILGLAVLAPDRWLAFGYQGTLLKTVDAGRTWSEKGAGTARYLAGSFAGRRGAVSGFAGALIHTDDEGETWRDAETPGFAGRLFGVAFVDSLTAVAAGDSGTVWRSVDGGASWTAVTGIPGMGTQTLSAVAFRPDGTGFIVGYGGAIFTSTDRGASWAAVASPVTRNLYAVAFRDDRTGIAGGARGTILKTRDGGATWESGTTGNADDNVYGAAWLGGDTAVVHGEWGHFVMVRLTADGGSTWAEVPVPSRQLLWALKGLGTGQAALLGQNGAIVIGTLQASSGIRAGGPVPSAPGAGFSVHRSGTGLRAVLALPRKARIRITVRSLDGRELGAAYRGERPAGRQVLALPGGRSRGPALYLLESEDAGPALRRSALLPY